MRILNIINDLIQSNKYLSIGYFMDRYCVSKRTLQNDFSYLTNISKSKGFNLIQKRGSGYLLEIGNKDAFYKFVNELDKISNQPKLNVENIIAYIALNDNYVTIDTIIDELKSSRSVIKSYKYEIDNYLYKYKLKMKRKSHYGIKIENSMRERRQLLVDLYIKENEIIKKYINSNMENDFKRIRDLLINVLKKNNLVINYEELKEILAWLRVTIYINENNVIDDEIYSKKEIENILGQEINSKIYKSDGFELKKLIKSKTRKKNKQNENIKGLYKDVDYFMRDFDKHNNTYFSDDEDFKKSLLNHISGLIERASFRISYKNPIINEIQIKYPIAFNIAILLSDMLKEKYDVHINCDEIGFIATYFAMHMEKQLVYKLKKYNSIAIVCSSGGGSAQLIKFKISSLFKNTDIRTFSILQIKELEEFNPDIIFSISQLNTKLEVPVIYVKELLDDYDILQIKELVMLENFNEASIGNTKEAFISKLFNPNYFNIEDNSCDYRESLKEMSIQIEEDAIGGNEYSQFVLKREGFASTVYLNGIALPHPIEMNGNANLVAVKILKKPIEYEGKKVSIIFMICLKKDSLELHKKITNDLYEIMSDIEIVQSLLRVNTYKEFVALINQRI